MAETSRVVRSEDAAPPMRLRIEPQIPASTEYRTVPQVRAAILALDDGQFHAPALLVERMLWNPRLRGVLETRMAGLLATEIRWEPARNNRDARRAAESMRVDWPIMMPSAVRRQMARWGLMLGFSLGQRVPLVERTTRRMLARARPYWPGWASWNARAQRYSVVTGDGSRSASVPSPSLDAAADPAASPWLVSEPYGSQSWRDGLLHAAWRPWFAHDLATRDQNRASEKHGIGTVVFEFPRGTSNKVDASFTEAMTALRGIGSEGVLPAEKRDDGTGIDYKPFEFSGQGFAAIDSALNAAAVALAILFLGHNLTTEIKGGSYAAAGVADYIRDDKKNEDAGTEWAWARPQLVEPWAIWNYGDPELAPVARYVTDSPAVNAAAATMYLNVASAIRELREHLPAADVEALAERFRVPLRAAVDVPEEMDAPAPEAAVAEDVPPASEEGAAAPSTEEAAAQEATLAITATDLASIVRVDEGRAAVGLDSVGGRVGGLWIREHAARLAALLPDPGADAPGAEDGEPTDAAPPVDDDGEGIA